MKAWQAKENLIFSPIGIGYDLNYTDANEIPVYSAMYKLKHLVMLFIYPWWAFELMIYGKLHAVKSVWEMILWIQKQHNKRMRFIGYGWKNLSLYIIQFQTTISFQSKGHSNNCLDMLELFGIYNSTSIFNSGSLQMS